MQVPVFISMIKMCTLLVFKTFKKINNMKVKNICMIPQHKL